MNENAALKALAFFDPRKLIQPYEIRRIHILHTTLL